MKLSKGLTSFLSLSLFLTLIGGGTVSADQESKEYINGFEVISTTEEAVVKDNGDEVTVTIKELNASKDDLEQLINDLHQQGRNILPSSPPEVSTFALGSGHFKGYGTCNLNYTDIQLCSYADFTATQRAGGLGGFAFKGFITAIAAITDNGGTTISNHKAIPRLRVMGYGITAKDNIFVAEWNFRSPNSNYIETYNFDEITPGFLAYAEFWAGADFSWKLHSNSYSTTVWAELTEL
ncbi:hypothetical protein [Paenibacillus antibioticophila]|uniref:hypothetical protein n=1 Tax=Paenibacillus antibioticophila TaxID=1274374 RepID=UPI0005CB3484|nr:hypothetical protein [Paenibacillus antibioticophila]